MLIKIKIASVNKYSIFIINLINKIKYKISLCFIKNKIIPVTK